MRQTFSYPNGLPELNNDVTHSKTLPLKRGDRFVEFVTQTLSRNEVKEYLVAADVICLPFKLVLSDAPISILEAMALRRPVISTDIAGIPEMLGDDGHLIGQNDISALAERIHLILENSKEWGSLSEFKTEHSMNDRTWSRVNEEFQVVVESLVGSK